MAQIPKHPASQGPDNLVTPDDPKAWSKNTGTSMREKNEASEERFCTHERAERVEPQDE